MKRFIAILLSLLLVIHFNIYAGNRNESWANDSIASTEGNDFWLTFMLNGGTRLDGTQEVIYLIAAAKETTKVYIDYPVSGRDSMLITPNSTQHKKVKFPNEIYCEDVGRSLSKGLHVYSPDGKPFSLYTGSYGSASVDASIIIPVSGLRKEYVIQTYDKDHDATEFAIVATASDTTHIALKPSNNLSDSMGIKGQVTNIDLAQGQVFFARSDSMAWSLTGTVICADQKVAVFSGGQFAIVPFKTTYTANHIFEQTIPTIDLGRVFSITKTQTQKKNEVRITAIEDHTWFKKDGVNVDSIRYFVDTIPITDTIPAVIDELTRDTIARMRIDTIGHRLDTTGYVRDVIYFNSTETYSFELKNNDTSTYIWASKPVLTYLYMTSPQVNSYIIATDDDEEETVSYGAPSMVMISPDEQGLNSVTFGTFQGTIPMTHYVNVTCRTEDIDDMQLDGVPINKTLFSKVKGSSENVTEKTHNMSFARIPIAHNHTHRLANNRGKFNAYVYGLNTENESYAYSAGFDNQPQAAWIEINHERVQELSICDCNPPDIQGVIQYEYNSVEWIFSKRPSDSDTINEPITDTRYGSVHNNYHFQEPGDWDITMVVHRESPVCACIGGAAFATEHDTVSAFIHVNGCHDITYEKDTCAGETIRIEGLNENLQPIVKTYTSPNKLQLHTITDVIPFRTTAGCDSTVHVKITFYPVDTTMVRQTICANEKFSYEGKEYGGGRYEIPHETPFGCKNITILDISTFPISTYTIDTLICDVDTPFVLATGKTASESGQYKDTLKHANRYGCDSIIIVNLTVAPTYNIKDTLEICQNGYQQWQGKRYVGDKFSSPLPTDAILSVGEHYDTRHYTTAAQCDSTYNLTLKVNPIYEKTITKYICQNELPDTLTYIDRVGTHKKIIPIIPESEFRWLTETLKDTLIRWNTQHLETIHGCDSVVHTQVVIQPTYEFFHTDTICESELKPYLWDGHIFNKPIDFKEGQTNIIDSTYNETTRLGCDSIVYYRLVVNPTYFYEPAETYCSTVLPIEWSHVDGKQPADLIINIGDVWEQGVLVDTVKEWRYQEPWVKTFVFDTISAHGCDSVVRFTATIYPYYAQHDTLVKPSGELPFTWRGHKITPTQLGIPIINDNPQGSYDGVLEFPYRTADDKCDSIVYLHLTVKPSYVKRDTLVVCDTELAGSGKVWNDKTFTLTLPTRTITTGHDEDFVQPFDTTFRFEYTSCDGIDSTVLLYFVVNPSYHQQPSYTICSSSLPYEVHGETFDIGTLGFAQYSSVEYQDSQTQTFTFNKTTTNDCDSIVDIHLTIHPAYELYFEDTICENQLPYAWSGRLYGKSDSLQFIERQTNTFTYYYPLKTQNGCDSLVHYKLVVNPTYLYEPEETYCSTALPISWSYVTGKQPADIIINVGDVWEQGVLVDTVKEWRYQEPWVKTFEFNKTSINHCDSIVRFTATIYPYYELMDEITIASGDLGGGGYTWHGHTYTAAELEIPIINDNPTGYLDTVIHSYHTSTMGCDSIVHLHIIVNPSYVERVTLDLCDTEVDGYNWRDTTFSLQHGDITITPYAPNPRTTQTIEYTFNKLSVDGNDSIVYLTLNIHPSYKQYEERSICSNELPYTFQDTTFNVGTLGFAKWSAETSLQANDTDVVFARKTVNNQCDSIVYLHLTIKPSYERTYTRTICESELPYTWAGHIFEKSATFIPEQTNIVDTTFQEISSLNCDSIVHYQLTINPIFNHYRDVVICSNELPLSWGMVDEKVDTIIREGDVWNGRTLQKVFDSEDYIPDFENTIVFDTISAHGCDSIVTLHVTIHPYYQWSDEMTIPSGDLPLIWHGHTYTPEILNIPIVNNNPTGSFDGWFNYSDEKTIAGCDSIVNLHLTVKPSYVERVTLDLCDTELDGYEWRDTTFSLIHGETTIIPYDPTPRSVQVFNYSFERKTVTTDNDSIVHLTLRVHPSYEQYETLAICSNELPYTFRDTTFNIGTLGFIQTYAGDIRLPNAADYTFYRTTRGEQHCDSIVHLHLTISPSYEQIIRDTICESLLPYEKDGHIFNKPNNFMVEQTNVIDSIYHRKSSLGCDSTIQYKIVVNPIYEHQREIELCSTDLPYSWGMVLGQVDTTFRVGDIWEQGVLQDTIKSGDYQPDYHTVITFPKASASGCDSTVNLTVTIHPYYEWDTTVVMPSGDLPYTWRGHTFTAQDLHIPVINDNPTGRCDTFLTYHRNYIPEHQCDSVVTLHLVVKPSYVERVTLDLCDTELDGYHWRDTTFSLIHGQTTITPYSPTPRNTQTFTYTFKKTTVDLMDSIVYLTLNIKPSYIQYDTLALCSADLPYTFRDTTFNIGTLGFAQYSPDYALLCQSQDYVFTRQTALECDSIVHLHLTICPSYEQYVEETICESGLPHIWNNKIYNKTDQLFIPEQSNTFVYHYNEKTINNCDSIVHYTLHIDPIYSYHVAYSFCENERGTYHGKGYAGDKCEAALAMDRVLVPGMHYDTIRYHTTTDCDSIYYLQIEVYPIYDTIVKVDICATDMPYPLEYYNHYTQQTIRDTLRFAPDDTFRMLDETQKDTLFRVYDIALTSHNGCDSIVHTHITIHPTYYYEEYKQICYKERPFVWEGHSMSFYDTGIYYDSLQTTIWGCDSVYMLDLYVKWPTVIRRDVETCDNETIYHHYPESNQYEAIWHPGDEQDPIIEKHLYDITGCDSIIYEYHITYYPHYQFDTTLNLCSNEPYNLHDNKVVGLATEYDPLICGHIPAKDTLFIDTLHTIYGCDSIYTAQATIYPQYRHIDSHTMCDNDSCQWRGHNYKNLSAGFYIFHDSLTTIHNCDSIYEFQLTITPTYFFEYHDTICDNEDYTLPYEDNLLLHGADLTLHTKDTTYFYADTLTTEIYGCDSVYHVYLTVNPTTDTTLYDTICKTDSYDLHGVMLYESGYYVDTTLNQWNCQHITHLYLEVEDPTKVTIQIGDVCADENNIEVNYTYEGRNPLSYSLFFDDFGHSQRFEDIERIPFTADSVVYIPIPYGDVLPAPPTHPTYLETDSAGYNYHTTELREYPRPGHYHVTISFQNGVCSDNLIHVDTVIELRFPHWIHEQHWNDGIVIFNERYNGGYSFDDYQWYHNDTLMPGEIEPYIYLPHELEFGDEYNVRLHIVGEAPFEYHFTCPIVPTLMPDTIVPLEEYFSVVPTLVHKGADGVDILCNHPGTYSVYTTTGLFISSGNYDICEEGHPATHVPLPQIPDIMYVFKLFSDSGHTRTIKVFHE